MTEGRLYYRSFLAGFDRRSVLRIPIAVVVFVVVLAGGGAGLILLTDHLPKALTGVVLGVGTLVCFLLALVVAGVVVGLVVKGRRATFLEVDDDRLVFHLPERGDPPRYRQVALGRRALDVVGKGDFQLKLTVPGLAAPLVVPTRYEPAPGLPAPGDDLSETGGGGQRGELVLTVEDRSAHMDRVTHHVGGGWQGQVSWETVRLW